MDPMTTGFPFWRLPTVAASVVVENMDLNSLMNTAKTSRRIKWLLTNHLIRRPCHISAHFDDELDVCVTLGRSPRMNYVIYTMDLFNSIEEELRTTFTSMSRECPSTATGRSKSGEMMTICSELKTDGVSIREKIRFLCEILNAPIQKISVGAGKSVCELRAIVAFFEHIPVTATARSTLERTVDWRERVFLKFNAEKESSERALEWCRRVEQY